MGCNNNFGGNYFWIIIQAQKKGWTHLHPALCQDSDG